MKKKFLSWILAIVSLFSCVGGLSACATPSEQPSGGGSSGSSSGNTALSDSEIADNGSSIGRLPGSKLQNTSTWTGGINSVSRNEGLYKGTHIYTADDTTSNLVENGVTEYKLIVPSSVDFPTSVSDIDTITDVDEINPDALAVYEFIKLFKEATGITITAEYDSSSTYQDASNGKYISLGRTKLLEKSGIDASKETLDNDGHIIKTIGDDIYLCGGADEGTVFAVYTFMRLTFNYETYYYDCMEIDSVTTVKLKNYDVTDIPDFKYRAHSTDVTTYDSSVYEEDIFAWRLRYYGKAGNRGYFFMPIHEEWDLSDPDNPEPAIGSKNTSSTNIRRWFPERIYNNPDDPDRYHPEWFSTMGGEQVCFSAHGDKESYELMVNTAFEKVKAQLKYYTPTRDNGKYKNKNIMSMTHEDNRKYCRCWKCKEISEANRDSQAAVQVMFMNDLAAKVNEYMELPESKAAEWYREDLKIMFFAYNHNMDAPAKYDAEQKKYVATDEKFYVNDRLIAWFARDANGQAVYNEGRNGEMITNLDCWSALANNIYFWNYGTNFSNYMVPYDSFEFATPEMYAYFCTKSDKFWFTQLQDNNPNTNTAWHNLKAYLEAKLSWDTSLDMDDLIANWFNAMYGDGASTMLELFKAVRTYQHNTLVVEKGLVSYGDGSPDVVKAEYWPVDMLQEWLGQIDTAKGLVSDEKIQNRMEAEALSNLYLLMALNKDSLDTTTQQTYIDRLTLANTNLSLTNMRITSSQKFPAWLATLSAS